MAEGEAETGDNLAVDVITAKRKEDLSLTRPRRIKAFSIAISIVIFITN